MKVGDLVRFTKTFIHQRGIVLECLTDEYWGATARVRFEDGRLIEVECEHLELVGGLSPGSSVG